MLVDEDDEEPCPEEFKQLESVDLSEYRPRLKHFQWLADIPNLETLNLNDENMKELVSAMPKLEVIYLPNDANGETLDVLAESHPQLKELHLGKASIVQSDLKKLKPFTQLKVLDLGKVPVKAKFVLSMAKGLPTVLELTGSRIQQESSIRKDLKKMLKERV